MLEEEKEREGDTGEEIIKCKETESCEDQDDLNRWRLWGLTRPSLAFQGVHKPIRINPCNVPPCNQDIKNPYHSAFPFHH